MEGARTRGHPAALAAVASMIRGGAPHAVLLVGPAGIGKTTLALDLAAGLLCTADEVERRPCGACRACRLAFAWSHPDLHRIGPEGPGRQVVIGGPGSRVRGIRDLIGELSLLPVEGGARVAIVVGAHRMNEDAQAALLKTLEEPPSGVTLILCADAEEPLLPTIRSRCARLRLGPVATRDVEAILEEHGVADAPLAARLARIAAGRPGVAFAWARQPDALRARDELSRSLLDLLAARPAERLAGVRAAVARAGALSGVLDRAGEAAPFAASSSASTVSSTAATPPSATPPGTDDLAASSASDAEAGAAEEAGPAARVPAVERRRSAEALVGLWSDVARDLALSSRGLASSVRDLGLLDETNAQAARLDGSELDAFLDRLGRAAVLLVGNVSPELVLDDLALAWPRPRTAAA
jgi:DNA polymerase III subunit delta'